ncbi:hypothetical protein ACHAWF_013737 [Thalassiosira exigua]
MPSFAHAFRTLSGWWAFPHGAGAGGGGGAEEGHRHRRRSSRLVRSPPTRTRRTAAGGRRGLRPDDLVVPSSALSSMSMSMAAEATDATGDEAAASNDGSAATSQATSEEEVCRPSYDAALASTYVAGTEVEVDGVNYRCHPYPYAIYCTFPDFMPKSTSGSPWTDVWEVGRACAMPTRMPSGAPSEVPTRTPTDVPTKVGAAAAREAEKRRFRFSAARGRRMDLDSISPDSCGGRLVGMDRRPQEFDRYYPEARRNEDEAGSPTLPPSAQPTASPSKSPSSSPTAKPTAQPSKSPTNAPSRVPSCAPSSSPSLSAAPTLSPTAGPTRAPTMEPSLYGCPPPYDPSAASSYEAGDEVEVDRVAYRCGAYPFSIYCTLPRYRPLSTEDVEWDDVWVQIGPCGTVRPTRTPSRALPSWESASDAKGAGGDLEEPTSAPSASDRGVEAAEEDRMIEAEAEVTFELRTAASELSDAGVEVFERTCGSFLTSRLACAEPPISDVSCRVTGQRFVQKGRGGPSSRRRLEGPRGGLALRRRLLNSTGNSTSLLLDVDVRGETTATSTIVEASDVDFDGIVLEAFANRSAVAFADELKDGAADAGIGDFADLDEIAAYVEHDEQEPTTATSELTNDHASGSGALLWAFVGPGTAAILLAGLFAEKRRRNARRWAMRLEDDEEEGEGYEEEEEEEEDYESRAEDDEVEDEDWAQDRIPPVSPSSGMGSDVDIAAPVAPRAHKECISGPFVDRGLPPRPPKECTSSGPVVDRDRAPKECISGPVVDRDLSFRRAPTTGPLAPSSICGVRSFNHSCAPETEAGSPTNSMSSPESKADEGDREPAPPVRFERQVIAPPGKLGIVLKQSVHGCAVHCVKPGSSVEGKMFGEDLIVGFNGTDVTGCSARDLTLLIAKNIESEKNFTVLSCTLDRDARGTPVRRYLSRSRMHDTQVQQKSNNM